eukprot:scaffold8.g1508.t1
MNPSVTLGLALIGGAILGSAFLFGVIPNSSASTLGSNAIASGVTTGNAFLGEVVMTFVLVSVVLETAVSKKSLVARAQAPLAIGFAVFCAHAVLLPIDGCSIKWGWGDAVWVVGIGGSFWVFIVAPFTGAAFAAPFHMFFRSDWDWPAAVTPQDVAVGMEKAGSLPSDAPHRGDTAGDMEGHVHEGRAQAAAV